MEDKLDRLLSLLFSLESAVERQAWRRVRIVGLRLLGFLATEESSEHEVSVELVRRKCYAAIHTAISNSSPHEDRVGNPIRKAECSENFRFTTSGAIRQNEISNHSNVSLPVPHKEQDKFGFRPSLPADASKPYHHFSLKHSAEGEPEVLVIDKTSPRPTASPSPWTSAHRTATAAANSIPSISHSGSQPADTLAVVDQWGSQRGLEAEGSFRKFDAPPEARATTKRAWEGPVQGSVKHCKTRDGADAQRAWSGPSRHDFGPASSGWDEDSDFRDSPQNAHGGAGAGFMSASVKLCQDTSRNGDDHSFASRGQNSFEHGGHVPGGSLPGRGWTGGTYGRGQMGMGRMAGGKGKGGRRAQNMMGCAPCSDHLFRRYVMPVGDYSLLS
ncbi:hypothetical protein CYMTET_33504 [Cymbomonas tetramitiformis]|uniref:FIGL1 N-terminal domain-containing protein n=1 Tax=Cymbomonas tetramitiformis TaxID=36881 RepID=A0AAE0FCQ5_9CHLO|nr:hypothetical protein CYMTET_33504 [Cymbomonas tetramitiformis]